MKLRPEFEHKLQKFLPVISDLSPSKFGVLVSRIRDLTPSFSISKQIRGAESDIISNEKLYLLIEVVSSLYGAHYSAQDSNAENIRQFLEELYLKFDDNSNIDSETLSRIETLIRLETPFTAGKAYAVIADHDKTYIKSKILSDIRPIFSGFASDKGDVVSATYSHSLKIESNSNGVIKTNFIALDINDLVALKANIEMAMEKENKMRKLMEEKCDLTSFYSEDLLGKD